MVTAQVKKKSNLLRRYQTEYFKGINFRGYKLSRFLNFLWRSKITKNGVKIREFHQNFMRSRKFAIPAKFLKGTIRESLSRRKFLPAKVYTNKVVFKARVVLKKTRIGIAPMLFLKKNKNWHSAKIFDILNTFLHLNLPKM